MKYLLLLTLVGGGDSLSGFTLQRETKTLLECNTIAATHAAAVKASGKALTVVHSCTKLEGE